MAQICGGVLAVVLIGGHYYYYYYRKDAAAEILRKQAETIKLQAQAAESQANALLLEAQARQLDAAAKLAQTELEEADRSVRDGCTSLGVTRDETSFSDAESKRLILLLCRIDYHAEEIGNYFQHCQAYTETLQDLAAMDQLQQDIRIRLILPLQAVMPDAKPKGLLLYGPSGTGKSHLLRGIANALGYDTVSRKTLT